MNVLVLPQDVKSGEGTRTSGTTPPGDMLYCRHWKYQLQYPERKNRCGKACTYQGCPVGALVAAKLHSISWLSLLPLFGHSWPTQHLTLCPSLSLLISHIWRAVQVPSQSKFDDLTQIISHRLCVRYLSLPPAASIVELIQASR